MNIRERSSITKAHFWGTDHACLYCFCGLGVGIKIQNANVKDLNAGTLCFFKNYPLKFLFIFGSKAPKMIWKFHNCLLPFSFCGASNSYVRNSNKQAGAELCQAQTSLS